MKRKKSETGFIGNKLEEARDARGESVASLSEKIDVSRQAIYNYENGSRSPEPNVLDSICRLLKFPSSFFFDNYTEDENCNLPTFYRSMSATTKRARAKAEAKFKWELKYTNLLDQLVELPPTNFPSIDTPIDPGHISNEFIEDVASQVRQFWGLGDGPISNFVWLLENNGALVVRRSLEDVSLDAFSRWKDGRPYVVLSSDKESAVRSRFDAAHELGHLILHRNVPEIYLNTPEYFKVIEHQAHRFAAAIQFPQKSFAREVNRLNLEAFCRLKRRWKLSIAMMLHRASDLDFLDERSYQNLYRNYGRKGWMKEEPLDDELPVELPKLIMNSTELLLKEGVLSRSEIVDEMQLYHWDVEDCVGLPSNYLNLHAGDVHTLRPRLRHEEHNGEKRGQILFFPPNEKITR